jgi:hypothetical protein
MKRQVLPDIGPAAMERAGRKSLCLAVAALVLMAQAVPRGPLEGVWKVTEIATGSNAPSPASPPPSVYIFTRGHYSILRVIGTGARTLFAAPQPTDAEKLAAYDTFVATSGTYELSGTTLITRPIVSKNPNLMGGGSETFQCRLEGDTLWLTLKSTDTRIRLGDRIEPVAGPATETRFRLARIE